MTTGEYIKNKRELLKISQIIMSGRLGMNNPQQLCNIESNSCSIPDKYYSDICRELLIKPNYLKKLLVNDYKKKLDRIF